jgi:ABC-type sugar transport system permease subunit
VKEAKPKVRLTLENRNAIAGYLFILPFLIGFFAFMFYPILQSAMMTFSDVKIDPVNRGFALSFSGFANLYRVFFVEPYYARWLLDDITKMLLTVPAVLIFSLFMAVLLNQEFKGRAVVRVIFFLPVILYSGIVVFVENNNTLMMEMANAIQENNGMKNSISGTLENILLSSSSTGYNLQYIMGYVFDVVDQIYSIAMSSAIQIIIFLSGLQTISPSMYEAAEIEGAAKWECFWKITFPMVSPLILVNVVYSVVDFFLRSDSKTLVEVRKVLMTRLDYGLVSAETWSYFAIVMVVLGIVSLIISRKVYYYE